MFGSVWREMAYLVVLSPPVPKIAHEVPWIELKHRDEDLEVEEDSADLRLSS